MADITAQAVADAEAELVKAKKQSKDKARAAAAKLTSLRAAFREQEESAGRRGLVKVEE